MSPTIRDWGQRYPHLVEPKYDIHPSESDLDDESLDEQVDLHQHCHCPSKQTEQAELVADDPRCERGAHHWTTICARCGHQQSRFENAEYLEWE